MAGAICFLVLSFSFNTHHALGMTLRGLSVRRPLRRFFRSGRPQRLKLGFVKYHTQPTQNCF